jgi:Ulp1 family protease
VTNKFTPPSRLSHSNKLILNYHDAVLYESDKNILECPTAWLNDACIHFYLTILQQQFPNVKFMDPSVITFLMHQCDADDLEDFSSGFDKDFVMYVIPVNDGHGNTTSWQHEGSGSHWSLLIVIRGTGTTSMRYAHLDSVSGSNARVAQAIASMMAKVLGDRGAVSVGEVRTPQQLNGYACGLHSLYAAKIIARDEFTSVENWETALENSKLGNPAFDLEMRRYILAKAVELSQAYRTG